MKSAVLFGLGLLLFLFGTFFALQGADVVHWPAESFMVGKRDWTEYGIVIAILGAMAMLASRRVGK